MTKQATRRGFGRQVWSAATVLACGVGVGAWWYWSRPWRNASAQFEAAQAAGVPVQRFEVVNTYPHDAEAFTQGLVFDGGVFYESTGLEERSSLRRVEIETGKVLDRLSLNRKLFGEGLALVGDELYQLTWQNEVCFVYDQKTFRLKRQYRYNSEGWGLTFDGKQLIFSDGTALLRFRDPKTFEVVRRLEVKLNGERLEELNELEYINGEVWANVWHKDWIVRIDPKSGAVNSMIDLSGLWPAKQPRDDQAVLNGIAHDPKKDRLFVTGKCWPRLYEIRVKA